MEFGTGSTRYNRSSTYQVPRVLHNLILRSTKYGVYYINPCIHPDTIRMLSSIQYNINTRSSRCHWTVVDSLHSTHNSYSGVVESSIHKSIHNYRSTGSTVRSGVIATSKTTSVHTSCTSRRGVQQQYGTRYQVRFSYHLVAGVL